MTSFFIFCIEIAYAISVLILIGAGLAVIFGMMRVINLAHGEFLTLGGYAAITAHQQGLNIWLSMLVIAPLTGALFGVLVERLIIRHLYGRLINTMLATWGLSLVMIGGFTMIFGNTTTGIPSPLGSFDIAGIQLSLYTLFVPLAAVAVIGLIWAVVAGSRAGLIARGTMQNPDMAAVFGYNTARVYMVTFAAGSALAGLSGGILAPLVGLNPFSGGTWIAKAFITVISGGTSLLAGLLASAGLLGIISQTITFLTTPVMGELALLLAALVLLRLLPSGISGRFFRNAP